MGERLETEQPREQGLVDSVVDEDARSAAFSYVRRLEDAASLALYASKKAVLAALR